MRVGMGSGRVTMLIPRRTERAKRKSRTCPSLAFLTFLDKTCCGEKLHRILMLLANCSALPRTADFLRSPLMQEWELHEFADNIYLVGYF